MPPQTYSHEKRFLSLTTPLGADKLLLDAFTGTEGVSELFDFSLDVLSMTSFVLDPTDLIGKRVTINIDVSDTGTKRPINGMVAAVETFGGDSFFKTYKLHVVPTLWLLSLNTQTRVFQGQTVVEIIKHVLSPYSITPKDNTQATYITLEYCTQYRETDLQFVMRLMEQHGIFFHFTHTASDHTMVLGDSSAQLSPCAVVSNFQYVPYSEGGASHGLYEAVIQSFGARSTLSTGQYRLWDYRFTQYATSKASPDSAATKSPLGSNSHEFYDYTDGASSYLKTDSGDSHTATQQALLQTVDRDRGDVHSVISLGKSNAATLQSGFTFTMTGYSHAAENTKYLVTHIEHQVRQVPSFRMVDLQMHNHVAYQNTFEAHPAAAPYRPRKVTPKPRVNGVVTGKVVAPSGDESYLDKYGRVCVQFWWDRHRKPNTTDNTLLRVAQTWAGKGWGSYFWPRLDDEVLIDFLDGDPDAPIVVGSLYNGTNLPKYDPAKEYTRAGIVTRSSKGGGAANANELRFDDLKGSEQIFINAEKDFDLHVENDNHWQVDNDQHATITGNRYETVGADHHSKVTGNVIEEVDADHSLTVQGKQSIAITGDKGEKIDGDHSLAVTGAASGDYSKALNEKVGMDYSLQVGQNHYNKSGMAYTVDSGQSVYIKGGMSVVIEAGMSLTLKAAGGFITIGPTGVMIQGMLVMINSGGAAVPGVPGMPMSPKPPAAPKSPTAPKWPGDDPRA